MDKPTLIKRISDKNSHQLVLNPGNLREGKLKKFFTQYGIENYNLKDDGNYEFEITSKKIIEKISKEAQFGKIGGYETMRAILYPTEFPKEINQYSTNQEILTTEKEISLDEPPIKENNLEKITKENQPKKSGKGTLYAITSLILAGSIGYNVYLTENIDKKTEDMKIQINELNTKKENNAEKIPNINTKYSIKVNELDTKIENINDELNNSINLQEHNFTRNLNSLDNKLEKHKESATLKINGAMNYKENEFIALSNKINTYEQNSITRDSLLINSIEELTKKLETKENKPQEIKKETNLWNKLKNIF